MRIYFEPKRDISAYEVAFVVANISGYGAPKNGLEITTEKWDALPFYVKRHFRIEKA